MQQLPENSNRIRNHLANERTFLAWIRTSLGIMAFGFVVEKFAFFLKKIDLFFSKQNISDVSVVSSTHIGNASFFGVFLVGLGSAIGLFAFVQYKKVKKQIDQDVYCTHDSLAIVLTVLLLAIGAFLIYYLLHS